MFDRYEAGFNVGLGFDGITVALLARVQPLLAIPAALLLGIMRAGQTAMAFRADVPQEIIDVILAIMLLLVCAPIVVRWIMRVRGPKDAVEQIQITSGWGSLMTPNRSKAFLWTVGVIGVIVVAYLFYFFNSETKTAAVLNGTFRQATPLVLAAMCGLLGERTGIVNIGIEGQLLMSAFTGFYVAAATGQHLDRRAGRDVVGRPARAVPRPLCAVTWSIDQIIAGTVINIFVAGLTSFLYAQGKTLTGSLPELDVPLLHEHPAGRCRRSSRTRRSPTCAMGLVFILHFALFHTRWGLRSRAVGEHPNAADSVGINVGLKRYVNTALAGGLAGLGGAFLSLEAVGTFERGHERAAWFHGAGDHDLRALEADPCVGRRAVLRVHVAPRRAAAVRPGDRRAATVHQHPAVRPRHPRAGDLRRPGAATRGGRSSRTSRSSDVDGRPTNPWCSRRAISRSAFRRCSPTTTSRSSCGAGRSSGCSARTAPARARSSRCSSGCTSPTKARS